MKQDIYPPLRLLKEVTEENPKIWENMAYYHDTNKNKPMWPDWCYAPIGVAYIIAQTCRHVIEEKKYKDALIEGYATTIFALAPWRLNKEVYVIDPDLKELLFQQEDDLEIPGEILLQLPYPCFYVELPDTYYGGEKIHGFFVNLEYDVVTHEKELRLTVLSENGNIQSIPIHIDAKTISENMQIIARQAHENTDDPVIKQMALVGLQYTKQMSVFHGKLLQIVLYILAQNAEITPNSEQALITKRGKTIKDKYSEIRKWNVGFRTGKVIRQYKEKLNTVTEEHNDSTHASPRPHMRRGHWHHFWTGPKNDKTNRKLVLKWLSPMMISVDTEDVNENPVVIHEVK